MRSGCALGLLLPRPTEAEEDLSFDAGFDLERAPSTASATMMRRLLLEKGSGKGSEGTADGSSASVAAPEGPRAPSPPRDEGGLSVRIEMASPSSPSDAPSLVLPSVMDEKIRRELRKRVARSWISWMEGWCMRLWEETAEGKGTAGIVPRATPREEWEASRTRVKVNVRSVVRRIRWERLEVIGARGREGRGGVVPRGALVGRAGEPLLLLLLHAILLQSGRRLRRFRHFHGSVHRGER